MRLPTLSDLTFTLLVLCAATAAHPYISAAQHLPRRGAVGIPSDSLPIPKLDGSAAQRTARPYSRRLLQSRERGSRRARRARRARPADARRERRPRRTRGDGSGGDSPAPPPAPTPAPSPDALPTPTPMPSAPPPANPPTPDNPDCPEAPVNLWINELVWRVNGDGEFVEIAAPPGVDSGGWMIGICDQGDGSEFPETDCRRALQPAPALGESGGLSVGSVEIDLGTGTDRCVPSSVSAMSSPSQAIPGRPFERTWEHRIHTSVMTRSLGNAVNARSEGAITAAPERFSDLWVTFRYG